MSGAPDDKVLVQAFVSEETLEEDRAQRQAQWEKVRTAEDPIEAPPEPEKPTESRSLFQQLKDQKDKKDDEFRESIRFKNMVRGLDEEERKFIDLCEREMVGRELEKMEQDRAVLQEFHEAVLQKRAEERAHREELRKQQLLAVSKAAADSGSTAAVAPKARSSKILSVVKRKGAINSEAETTVKRNRSSEDNSQDCTAQSESSPTHAETSDTQKSSDSNSETADRSGESGEVPSTSTDTNTVVSVVFPSVQDTLTNDISDLLELQSSRALGCLGGYHSDSSASSSDDSEDKD